MTARELIKALHNLGEENLDMEVKPQSLNEFEDTCYDLITGVKIITVDYWWLHKKETFIAINTI